MEYLKCIVDSRVIQCERHTNEDIEWRIELPVETKMTASAKQTKDCENLACREGVTRPPGKGSWKSSMGRLLTCSGTTNGMHLEIERYFFIFICHLLTPYLF